MLMIETIITGTQSKAADGYAINTMGIPSLDLMENASQKVAKEILAGCDTDARILICCGVGNNGADGVCIGRILLEHGCDPEVVICGSEEKQTDEFCFQLNGFASRGGRAHRYAGEERFDSCDLIVDAVFGIGLHRTVEGRYADFIKAASATSKSKTVAVDIPSGIDADTGELMGCGIKADLTVTFGINKTGLTINDGPAFAGDIKIVDIGIPEEAYRSVM